MATLKYRTNLNCGSCVAAVKPLLDGEPAIGRWSVDTADPDKVLTAEGEGLAPGTVERLVGRAGFRVLGEVGGATADPAGGGAAETATASQPTPPSAAGEAGPRPSYYPIALLFGFLVLGAGLLEARDGGFDGTRAMARFMGGFFLAFAFFKLLDLRGFADAFAGYDLVAGRWRGYAYAYPFVELALGAAYLSGAWPVPTNVVTLVVMSVGTAGVVRTLLARRAVRCACLGAVFNLPMSYLTLAEDALMAVMAAVMLAGGGHG